MIFKRIYVRKRFLKDLDKVNIKGAGKKVTNRLPYRQAIAVPLVCILLFCTVIAFIAFMNNKEKLLPNLKILPAINRDELSDFPSISHSDEYPDFDLDSIKVAPVYKLRFEKDPDTMFDNVIRHFNINRDDHTLDVTRTDLVYGTGYYKTYNLDGKYNIELFTIGIFRIDLIKYSSDNIFRLNIPFEKGKDEVGKYLLEYVNNNYDLFKIDAKSVIFESYESGYFYARLVEKEPETVVEKILHNLYKNQYVAFIYNHGDISVVFNPPEELTGDYPLLTAAEAIEKYRAGLVTCYNTDVEIHPDRYDLSFEDEVVEVELSYINDGNDYCRPVYNIILKTADNDSYIAVIDAIKDIYIEKRS